MSSAFKITLGGRATVHCVHDREKRVVTDPEQVAYLGRLLDQDYDPRWHKLIRCSCCENLFVSDNDTPRFCDTCTGRTVHMPAGSLPKPEGAIE
jgi:hypothetical protein